MFYRQSFLLASAVRLASAVVPFTIGNWDGLFQDNSGILQSLSPNIDPRHDFMAVDYAQYRKDIGNYHTGDINFKFRRNAETRWVNAGSALTRDIVPANLPVTPGQLLVSDFTKNFATQSSGINVNRTWFDRDGDLVVQWDFANNGLDTIEIGALGFPIEIDNVFTNRDPSEAQASCSFAEPYIGLGAGYVQVTALSGTGPNMVITPSTVATKLEAWTFLEENTNTVLQYQSNNWEGNWQWNVYSKAFAETEWNQTEPWNEPTSLIMKPGQTASFGLRFTPATSNEAVEGTVNALGLPVAIGVPSFVVPRDNDATLFLSARGFVTNITTTPPGAFTLTDNKLARGQWKGYTLQALPQTWGRVRVNIAYDNGMTQSVHYWVSEPTTDAIQKLGNHINTKHWFKEQVDYFHRAPSFLSFDRGKDSIILEEPRAYISGLGDDAGLGSALTLALKQIVQPDPVQVANLEQFVNLTLWGDLQVAIEGEAYGVKRSLFFYQPDAVPDYEYNGNITWTSTQNEAQATALDRTYNYVHVSAIYWALYKASRVSPGILKMASPSWYLNQAYGTIKYALSTKADGASNTAFAALGLTGESVWLEIVNDLVAEGLQAEADALKTLFNARQALWAASAFPFASDRGWDCIAEEAVYFSSMAVGDYATAQRTVDAIHGYDPNVAHWAYQGNAHRWWSFPVSGQPDLARFERQVHHFASSLNGIVLMDWVRRQKQLSSAKNFNDLRIAFAGQMSSLSNIDQDGFPSMGFHSLPETLAWDNYNGDYGPNFLGHVLGSISLLMTHTELGWMAFGGNAAITPEGPVTVVPRDTLRRKIFVAPLGLYVTLEGGYIASYTYDPATGGLSIECRGIVPVKSEATLLFSQTSTAQNPGAVTLTTPNLQQARGGYIVPIPANGTEFFTLQFARA